MAKPKKGGTKKPIMRATNPKMRFAWQAVGQDKGKKYTYYVRLRTEMGEISFFSFCSSMKDLFPEVSITSTTRA